ncbi:hypothetical protein [Anaeromicropila herbilytica]|uniref:DUF2975 domain-containing protein n=1 Tax=Anaeromicropila herbilytica TaxID=2785025 RepID=A0A7R7EQZ3_9FIRM|nr:hypothetical protein [Anaeromicropila herbilytica]BCN32897.1 hypothetical protein bsdtb5_41920 [Anaeromicropila herbilytica]
MKINKLISWLNVTGILLKVGGILFYLSNLLTNSHLHTLAKFNNTKIYVPTLTTYQFEVISTIPLFILILIGLKRFITILKSVEKKETPFFKECVTTFRNYAKTILIFGVVKVMIGICGNAMGLIPANEFNFDVVVVIFPLEYVVASLMMYGVAYIIDSGIKLQSENDMFI